ncbi:hypothetical protein ACOI1H_05715 [Loktanella sp. DJP18]
MAGKTNESMTGDGKAVDATKRQKERPEGADHIPLKDDKKTEEK